MRYGDAPKNSARNEMGEPMLKQALQRGPVMSNDAQEIVHGAGPIGRFNRAVALKITTAVGSMWMAYIFALLTLISLPTAILSHDPLIIVGWIAQTFLQLVLLPIIIVGQNVQSAHADARSETDHEILTRLHDINQEQLAILKLLGDRSGRS
jgi:hypothetical protein